MLDPGLTAGICICIANISRQHIICIRSHPERRSTDSDHWSHCAGVLNLLMLWPAVALYNLRALIKHCSPTCCCVQEDVSITYISCHLALDQRRHCTTAPLLPLQFLRQQHVPAPGYALASPYLATLCHCFLISAGMAATALRAPTMMPSVLQLS